MDLKINRRLKNLVDTELRYLGTVHDEHPIFSKDEVKIIDTSIKDFSKDLNRIDENITYLKLEVTGEVVLREILESDNLSVTNFSSNKVRDIVHRYLMTLVDLDNSEDFYTLAIQSICVIAAACKIYLCNIENGSTLDFNTPGGVVE